MEIVDLFRIALRYVLTQKKRGTQSHIADTLNIPRTTMSDFIAGRQTISEDKRAKISEELGYHYEDLLSMGRQLFNDTKDLKSIQIKIHTENIPEWIVCLISKLKNLDTTGQVALSAWLDGYLSKSD